MRLPPVLRSLTASIALFGGIAATEVAAYPGGDIDAAKAEDVARDTPYRDKLKSLLGEYAPFFKPRHPILLPLEKERSLEDTIYDKCAKATVTSHAPQKSAFEKGETWMDAKSYNYYASFTDKKTGQKSGPMIGYQPGEMTRSGIFIYNLETEYNPKTRKPKHGESDIIVAFYLDKENVSLKSKYNLSAGKDVSKQRVDSALAGTMRMVDDFRKCVAGEIQENADKQRDVYAARKPDAPKPLVF